MFKMAERSDSCSGETLLAPCTRKKRLQGKMTEDNYWIGVQENIGMLKGLCREQKFIAAINCLHQFSDHLRTKCFVL